MLNILMVLIFSKLSGNLSEGKASLDMQGGPQECHRRHHLCEPRFGDDYQHKFHRE